MATMNSTASNNARRDQIQKKLTSGTNYLEKGLQKFLCEPEANGKSVLISSLDRYGKPIAGSKKRFSNEAMTGLIANRQFSFSMTSIGMPDIVARETGSNYQ